MLDEQVNSSCVVFWTELGAVDDHAFALLANLLSGPERARAAELAPGPARDRFVLAAALLRTVLADATGAPAATLDIDRSCRWCCAQHGKPRLRGALAGWQVSVCHGGRLIGVALTRAGRVGLDVEPLEQRNYRAVLPVLLASTEPEPGSARDFLTYWTRKESVVKATGDGLVQPLPEVFVTAPDAAPRLLRYGSGQLPATMADLRPDSAHVAALTVLTSGPVEIRQQWLPAVPIPEAA